MTHHAAFSTRVRNQKTEQATGHGVSPGVIHGKSEAHAAKTKGLLHDSAFLAERGCLGADKLPGHSGQAHPR